MRDRTGRNGVRTDGSPFGGGAFTQSPATPAPHANLPQPHLRPRLTVNYPHTFLSARLLCLSISVSTVPGLAAYISAKTLAERAVAEPLYRQALADSRAKLGPRHLDTITFMIGAYFWGGGAWGGQAVPAFALSPPTIRASRRLCGPSGARNKQITHVRAAGFSGISFPHLIPLAMYPPGLAACLKESAEPEKTLEESEALFRRGNSFSPSSYYFVLIR